ncbi:MAG: DUF2066 domain-containing protein [Nevskiales bacterium]
MNFPLHRSLAAALALLPLLAYAQVETDPYSFERVVPDQVKATRDAVLGDALAEVLVRVSGDRQAPNSVPGKNLIARAVSLLQEYDYFHRLAPPPLPPEGEVTTPPDEAPAQPPPEELVLHGRFDENAINKELRRGGLPIWSGVRPQVVAALLLREGNMRLLTAETTPAAEVAALVDVALQRGLSVVLPGDPGAAPEALWNTAPDALANQFRVTGGNALLRGRITHVGDTWGAGWSLVQSGRVLADWEHYAASLAEVLVNGAHTAADTLAAHYSVKNQPGQDSFVSLRVSGVRGLADYARVQKYLASLTVVDKAELQGVSGQSLLFRVHTKGDATSLERALQLGKLITPDPTPAGADFGASWSGELRLSYRLAQPSETP